MGPKYLAFVFAVVAGTLIFLSGFQSSRAYVPADQLGSSGLSNAGNLATATTPGLAPSYNAPAYTNLSTAGRPMVTTNTATGYQLSTTSSSHVSYNVTVSTTATIGGASSGLVTLQTCSSNSVIPTAWQFGDAFGNSQTFGVVIGISCQQTTTGHIGCDVPIGYYVRMISSGSGTYTNTFNGGVEKINSPGY